MKILFTISFIALAFAAFCQPPKHEEPSKNLPAVTTAVDTAVQHIVLPAETAMQLLAIRQQVQFLSDSAAIRKEIGRLNTLHEAIAGTVINVKGVPLAKIDLSTLRITDKEFQFKLKR